MWVLFVLASINGNALSQDAISQFKTKSACEHAAQTIKKDNPPGWGFRIITSCINTNDEI